MNVLITGGCGFVGSNLAISLKKKYPHYQILCFDNLKRRGSELNLARLKEFDISFIHGDIRVASDFDEAGPIDLLIEAAAEPSVLAGLNGGTEYLIDTNLNGTVNCLNFALKNKAKFLFLSTSRIYPIEPLESLNYTEQNTRFSWTDNQPLLGISSKGVSEAFTTKGYRSLYGTTKLSSELIIDEYHHMLGLETLINRCGVLTGPYQMGKIDQGVIVLWAAKHFWKKDLAYIGYGGEGKQVRDLLHVDDLFNLIDFQIHNFSKINGKTYNVGGGKDCSLSLQELTDLCQKHSGNKISINKIKENRPADLRIYLTDNTKVTSELGWKPLKTPDNIISEIYDWINVNQNLLKPLLS